MCDLPPGASRKERFRHDWNNMAYRNTLLYCAGLMTFNAGVHLFNIVAHACV